MRTTNYLNTFIEVAEDCYVSKAMVPPENGTERTIARLQYELISENPYTYTSDDVLFMVHARRSSISQDTQNSARAAFFSKSQPCLRSSPLPKRYGWGIHCDQDAKLALYALESPEYEAFATDTKLAHKKALCTSKPIRFDP